MPTKSLMLPLLLGLSTLFYFCAKDQRQVEENPFYDFFNDASIVIDTIEQSVDTWEYGFAFTPLRSGEVSRFGIKLPGTGNFQVTLWDLSGATPSIIETRSVSASTKHQNAESMVSNVFLEKGVKYGITVRSNIFYRIRKAGNESFSFPRTAGNLRIESFNEGINNNSEPEFPTTTNDTRVAPCVNVIFIAD